MQIKLTALHSVLKKCLIVIITTGLIWSGMHLGQRDQVSAQTSSTGYQCILHYTDPYGYLGYPNYTDANPAYGSTGGYSISQSPPSWPQPPTYPDGGLYQHIQSSTKLGPNPVLTTNNAGTYDLRIIFRIPRMEDNSYGAGPGYGPRPPYNTPTQGTTLRIYRVNSGLEVEQIVGTGTMIPELLGEEYGGIGDFNKKVLRASHTFFPGAGPGTTVTPGEYAIEYSSPYIATAFGTEYAYITRTCRYLFRIEGPVSPPPPPAGTGTPLTIRGALLSGSIRFLRGNGNANASAATLNEGPTSSNLAESFIYTPSVWLDSPFVLPTTTTGTPYDSITHLPPVL